MQTKLAGQAEMSDTRTDIVAVMSRDWNGVFDMQTCQITDDGTKGFCFIVNAAYAIHPGADVQVSYVKFEDAGIHLHPADWTLIPN